jgi:hypothetical protein
MAEDKKKKRPRLQNQRKQKEWILHRLNNLDLQLKSFI